MKFKFKGIEVYIGFPFVAASTLMLLFDRTNIALFSLTSALIHELGHLVMMVILREKPSEIKLSIFGMRIKKYMESFSVTKEIAIASAGPLINITLALVLAITSIILSNKELMIFSSVNLSIGLFNSLPIAESDGEHVLECILKKYFNEEDTEKISFVISIALIIPIFFYGFYLLIKSRYNFSLLVVSIYLIMLVVLKKKRN